MVAAVVHVPIQVKDEMENLPANSYKAIPFTCHTREASASTSMQFMGIRLTSSSRIAINSRRFNLRIGQTSSHTRTLTR